MRSIQNSEEAALKRRRIAVRGKIKRRHDRISEMQHEALLLERELRMIDAQLHEYKS